MKPQFASPQHPKSRETHRGAGAVWHSNNAAQIFQPVLPPRLLPQELQRCDPLDVMLQPFVPDDMAGPAPNRLPESLLFPARSTECLPRCYRKRCAPNRGEWLLALANAQNCDAWRVQSNPTPSGPLQQDYAHLLRDPLPNLTPRLTRAYPSAPLLVRSLRPVSLGKRRSLRDATRKTPYSTNSRRPAYRRLPDETGRLPSARSEHHAPRIVERTRNHPKRRAWLPNRCRPNPLASGHLSPGFSRYPLTATLP